MLSNRSELLGWELQEITAELARRYGFRPGAALIVTDLIPGKLAEQSGLRRGDFIIEINRNHVGTFEGLRDILAVIDPGDPMLLLVRRGRRTFFTTVRMPKG